MDANTFEAYASKAAAFASDWLEQPFPDDLRDLVERYFQRGGATVDVGCGAGRDTAWLNTAGFPTVGIEPVAELIALAREANPNVEFIVEALPDLPGVQRGCFANVFCETVLMHLSTGEIARAVRTLKSLLRPGGTLYISWRVTPGEDQRDAHGRLYTSFDPKLITDQLRSMTVLLDEEQISLSSQKLVHRVVARAKQ